MKRRNPRAFSIIELAVVVTTIGVLALLGFPGFRQVKDRALATVAANDIQVFTNAIEIFSTQSGSFPESMTYTRMPEEISDALPSAWKDGDYSWFYIRSDRYTYIYVYNLRFTAEQAVQVDAMVDDGNIADGSLRIAFNGTGLVYLFELDESIFEPDQEAG